MKLSVLTDELPSGEFLSEHGLSYFIEYDGFKILFDTGHSDVFRKNAAKLKIDLNSEFIIVLSHGHWDHGNGLQFIDSKPLICHPSAFMKRFRRADTSNIGLKLNYKELCDKFDITTSSKPFYISEKIIFLGEIPRINSFESQTTAFVDENNNPDFVPDDSALVIIENKKLIIVSGCAHAGICNTIEYAKSITQIDDIKVVIGGFHLKLNNLQTQKTIEYFKSQNIEHILPSHCTQLPALAAFYNSFKIKQVRTGMTFEF